ncbi:MAG: spermidine synthase [Limisphaerales bacterium]
MANKETRNTGGVRASSCSEMPVEHASVATSRSGFLSPWTKVGGRLFALGFLTLFLELLFIRYLAGSIWNLGYFPNTVLLSAFVGMGIGFVFHHHITMKLSQILFIVGFACTVGLVVFVSYKHPIVPGFDLWHYDLDGDLYFSYIPFKVDDLNYVFFISCFALVIFIFACVSQRTAKLFRQFSPLDAYTLDILGSCAGVLAFMGASALGLPAYIWFIIFALIFLFAMDGMPLLRLIPGVLSLIAITVMHHQDTVFMRDPASQNPLQSFWSPYQKIEYVEEVGRGGVVRRRIFVNGLDHQEMHSKLDGMFYQAPYLYRAQQGRHSPKNVLIIGAGSGNDVTAALQNNASHIDAVEIDPVIAQLGREHNPSGAYRDSRVNVVINDGRAFMTQTQRKYDLIVFALTDSLVKVSSLTQLRLENYLFTEESVSRAYDLLEEDGNLVFYNFYRLPFVADKIQDLVQRATGAAPKILMQDNDFFMVCGEKHSGSPRQPYFNLLGSASPTDDWPFLYLQTRGIPNFYLKAIAAVLLLIVGLLTALHLSTRKHEEFNTQGLLSIKIAFVIMGIAFLLLEAKSVIQFSLLFGATWFNNSLIFLAVLLTVLVANWTVRFIKNLPEKALFLLLIVSALAAFFFPLHNLLQIHSVFLRFVAAAVIMLSPIYFANLIFSTMFKNQRVPEHIFGWNLLGATLGGVLEYVSMAFGYNALSLIVVVCYSAVFFLFIKARRQMEQSNSAVEAFGR